MTRVRKGTRRAREKGAHPGASLAARRPKRRCGRDVRRIRGGRAAHAQGDAHPVASRGALLGPDSLSLSVCLFVSLPPSLPPSLLSPSLPPLSLPPWSAGGRARLSLSLSLSHPVASRGALLGPALLPAGPPRSPPPRLGKKARGGKGRGGEEEKGGGGDPKGTKGNPPPRLGRHSRSRVRASRRPDLCVTKDTELEKLWTCREFEFKLPRRQFEFKSSRREFEFKSSRRARREFGHGQSAAGRTRQAALTGASAAEMYGPKKPASF